MIARLSDRIRGPASVKRALQTLGVVVVAAAVGLMPLAGGAGAAEAAGEAGHDAANCDGGYF